MLVGDDDVVRVADNGAGSHESSFKTLSEDAIAVRRQSKRTARSPEHARLGALLRSARLAAGLTTRDVPFSSGHVSNVEGGHVTPSQDYLDVFIDVGADRQLAEGLLAAIDRQATAERDAQRRALRGEPARMTTAPQAVDSRTRAADVRRHYSVDSYDVEFVFSGTGAIREVSSRVALRAVSDEVFYYYAGHAPDDGHQTFGPPVVSASAGAELDRINLSPVGAFDMFFRLTPPMTPDDVEAHIVEYKVVLDDEKLADPVIMYLAPPGAKCHALRVRFESPVMPERIWWFGAPDAYQADHPEPDAELPRSADGRYELVFEPLIAGWCYGFTWRWPVL
jgi:hypothetical protein